MGSIYILIIGGVSFMGNVWFVVVVFISYFLFSKNGILAMGDLEDAWYLNLGRCREPPYLVRLWYVMLNCPGSLSASSISC